MLVVDYYILRKQTLDLDKLYDENGSYKGVNMAAVIAMVVGIVVALTFSSISWYASLIPTGFIYWILMLKLPAAKRFMS